jgi:hypothetical protein
MSSSTDSNSLKLSSSNSPATISSPAKSIRSRKREQMQRRFSEEVTGDQLDFGSPTDLIGESFDEEEDMSDIGKNKFTSNV